MDNQPLIISWKFQGVLHMASCPISSVASAPAAATLGKKELQRQTPCRRAGSRNHFAGHSMWVNTWAASLSLFTFVHWRTWQPTPVFLPGESQGRGAWWAAVYGVSQSQTRLKWRSSRSSNVGQTDHNHKTQEGKKPLMITSNLTMGTNTNPTN